MVARGARAAPTRAAIRSRSSMAALRLKVRTRMRAGSPPRAIRAATDSTSVVVLPVPGPARTSSGPERCSTTARCDASSRGGSGTATGVRTSRYPPSDARRAVRRGGVAVREGLLMVRRSWWCGGVGVGGTCVGEGLSGRVGWL